MQVWEKRNLKVKTSDQDAMVLKTTTKAFFRQKPRAGPGSTRVVRTSALSVFSWIHDQREETNHLEPTTDVHCDKNVMFRGVSKIQQRKRR